MDELTKFIKDLLMKWKISGLAQYTEIILFFLVGGGAGILVAIWKGIKCLVKFFNHKRLSKDLHPFFTPMEIKKATEFYVPTQCQNVAPSREEEPGFTHAFATREKTIPFFLNKGFKYNQAEYRFYIILADSGMGKTTFLINLYLKYVSKWIGKEFKIKLLPLGFHAIDKELDNIEEKEKMILLLDALDEDSKAMRDYKHRINEIVQKTFRFRKVIITCRTQFFPSEEEEPKDTGIFKFGGDKGFHIFRKLYISPFDEKDIKRYLKKKFSIFYFKNKQKALKIVKQSPNLMVRPMLLSYIDDLLESRQKFESTCQVYKYLIDKWIEREAQRLPEKELKVNFKKELFKFSGEIALDIYRKRKNRNGLFIDGEEIKPFAIEHHVKLEDMELKSRSLLNRDAQGQYKFSHKSILEYFLALEIVENIKFYIEFNFEEMNQVKSFYDELLGDELLCKSFAFRLFTQGNLSGFYETSNSTKRKSFSTVKFNELDRMKYLKLSSRLHNINALKSLNGLIELDLENTNLTDISPLKELRKLKYLRLNNNQITDISALKELKELTSLYLSNNNLTDICSLRNLVKLEGLTLENNDLTDLRPLKKLKSLKFLWLKGNPMITREQIDELKRYLPNCNINYGRTSQGQVFGESMNLSGDGGWKNVTDAKRRVGWKTGDIPNTTFKSGKKGSGGAGKK
jgi:hypothetical protein